MRSAVTPRLALIATLALLAACKDNPPAASLDDGERAAEGEVLGGSISDDMLPLDSVTSQSPPREVAGSAGNGGDGASEDGDAAPEPDAQQQEETESDPAPEPAPAPEPDAEE